MPTLGCRRRRWKKNSSNVTEKASLGRTGVPAMRPMCMSATLAFSPSCCRTVTVCELSAKLIISNRTSRLQHRKPLNPNTGIDQTTSDSISGHVVIQLCFHSRYGSTSRGKMAIHSLSAARRRKSCERSGFEFFFPPPKVLQNNQRYIMRSE